MGKERNIKFIEEEFVSYTITYNLTSEREENEKQHEDDSSTMKIIILIKDIVSVELVINGVGINITEQVLKDRKLEKYFINLI